MQDISIKQPSLHIGQSDGYYVAWTIDGKLYKVSPNLDDIRAICNKYSQEASRGVNWTGLLSWLITLLETNTDSNYNYTFNLQDNKLTINIDYQDKVDCNNGFVDTSYSLVHEITHMGTAWKMYSKCDFVLNTERGSRRCMNNIREMTLNSIEDFVSDIICKKFFS